MFHPSQTQSFWKWTSIHRPGKADSSFPKTCWRRKLDELWPASKLVLCVLLTPGQPIKTERCLWPFSDILNVVTHLNYISRSVLGETFVAIPWSCYLQLGDLNNCPVQAGSVLGKQLPWKVHLEKMQHTDTYMLGPGLNNQLFLIASYLPPPTYWVSYRWWDGGSKWKRWYLGSMCLVWF